ncbi:MAG: bifunctional methylenetetrahydrofolate dehydrogenase/methenyltetrahydrofolate cyclohydrolase [Epulopiscium sp. Nuni2H_MBin003]|nr:MAG: bifunctional methylenetetrahydrofolate dehydrogenase/methenyltetrahydrofolate cyclohydrolase [Epulopiscium sp. Nuni2H_MBin003]
MDIDTKVIDGSKISSIIKEELKKEIALGLNVGLAVIMVGDNKASEIYVRNKRKACEYIGIKSFIYKLPEETTTGQIMELVEVLNNDNTVDGILIQLPLPNHINTDEVVQSIDKNKDVDGFCHENLGALISGTPNFISCTPIGIIELLKRYEIPIDSQKCVIIGRSSLVGKPLSMLLLNENATVTICHSKTNNLYEQIKDADIIISATGQINLVTGDMIKKGAVIIDVGINKDKDGKLCGDVDYASCIGAASFITPVPGGVGPMTVAMLMKNCVTSAVRKVN